MRIDAHQHFWNYDPVSHVWITDEMAVIRRDFLPDQLIDVLKANGFAGSVAVQADQTLKETEFLLELSARHDFIKGVVGWVDLQSDTVTAQLDRYKNQQKFKGVRHILQGESQRDLMLQPAFLNGIKEVIDSDLTYDILIYPDQLQFIPALLAKFPNGRFVLDHIAKPDIKHANIADWSKELKTLSQFPNLYCKISGMVTEADLLHWKAADFTPYLDAVVETFGTQRIMYGSDWPVCLVAGNYQTIVGIVAGYFNNFSESEKSAFFGDNAIDFYNLSS